MKPSVLITGASYGVGEQAAYQFAKQGYQVAITATRIANLSKTKQNLEDLGCKPLCLELHLQSQRQSEIVHHYPAGDRDQPR